MTAYIQHSPGNPAPDPGVYTDDYPWTGNLVARYFGHVDGQLWNRLAEGKRRDG